MKKTTVKINRDELTSIIRECVNEEFNKADVRRGQIYANHPEEKYSKYAMGSVDNLVQGIYRFTKLDLSGNLDYVESANDCVKIIEALKKQIKVMQMAEANLYNRITGKVSQKRAPRQAGGMRAPRRKFDWSALGDTSRRYGYRDPNAEPVDAGTNTTGSYVPQSGGKFSGAGTMKAGLFGQGHGAPATSMPGWSGVPQRGFFEGINEGMFSDPVETYMKTYRKITDPQEMQKAYDAIANRILEYRNLIQQLESRISKWEGDNTIYDLNKGNRDMVARAKEFRKKFRWLRQDEIVSLVKNNVPCDYDAIYDFLFSGWHKGGQQQIAESVDHIVKRAIKSVLNG